MARLKRDRQIKLKEKGRNVIITESEARAIQAQNDRIERKQTDSVKVTPKQKRQNHAMTSHSCTPDTRLDNLAEHIDANAHALSRCLHFPEKQVAKILQYWAKRVPIDERLDLVQTLSEKLLKEAPPTIKLAFVTMKRDTIDYMRNYYCFEKSKLSLDTPTGEDHNTTLGDIIPDTFEFSVVSDLKLDTARLLREMGGDVRGIVGRKLAGVRLTNEEKQKLEDFGRTHLDFVYA